MRVRNKVWKPFVKKNPYKTRKLFMWFVFTPSLGKHHSSWWQPPNKSHKGTLLNSFKTKILSWSIRHSAEPCAGKKLELSHGHLTKVIVARKPLDSRKWTLLCKSDVQRKTPQDACHLFRMKGYLEILREKERESDAKNTSLKMVCSGLLSLERDRYVLLCKHTHTQKKPKQLECMLSPVL